MKKKKQTLWKLALFALTFSAALLTGCKKDNREKIDLSSIHTTSANETMAAETTPPTVAGTTTAVTQPASGTDKTTTAPGGNKASSANKVSAKVNTYVFNLVSIEYPSVVNVEDASKAAAIDKLLKENALSILTAYGVNDAQDHVAVKCKVIAADRSRITAVYTGTYQAKDTADPVNLFYSNTIDVNKADNIGFSRFADPYTMAGYVLSNDCEFDHASPELTAELMKVKNETAIEAYTNLFNQADFPFSGAFPQSFSYEDEGTIFFSIPVPHELGDYAIVKYTPETK